MSFTITYQGLRHLKCSGFGYWQVNHGPIVLAGRPCRDKHRAKARAEHYVNSGQAAKRLAYLTNP